LHSPAKFVTLLLLALALLGAAGCRKQSPASRETRTEAPRGSIELVFPYGSEKEKWINDVTGAFNHGNTKTQALLTPGAAEALAVKIYRQVRTSPSSLNDVLVACLTAYQNPIAEDVMAFQIRLAASEATDLEFVPAMFPPKPATR
jgi:hypothetical protein